MIAYKVQKGDTLLSLGKKFQIPYMDIARVNPIIKDPNVIQEGWNFKIPGFPEIKAARKVGLEIKFPELEKKFRRDVWDTFISERSLLKPIEPLKKAVEFGWTAKELKEPSLVMERSKTLDNLKREQDIEMKSSGIVSTLGKIIPSLQIILKPVQDKLRRDIHYNTEVQGQLWSYDKPSLAKLNKLMEDRSKPLKNFMDVLTPYVWLIRKGMKE